MNRIFTILAMLFVSLQLATQAHAEWVVERASSSVWASPNGADWRDIEVGERFAATTWIQTGERGQVIFSNGSERIVYRPSTIATLASQGRNTNVRSIRGSVLLSIDPNRGGTTVVETPHLAAVVLGTVLEVTMSAQASSVRVDEGRVEVRHGGRRAVLERGQEGVVQSNSTGSIDVRPARVSSIGPDGSRSSFVTGAPRPVEPGALGNASANSNAGNDEGRGNARNIEGRGNAGNVEGRGNAGNVEGRGNAGNVEGRGNAGNAEGRGSGDDDDDDEDQGNEEN